MTHLPKPYPHDINDDLPVDDDLGLDVDFPMAEGESDDDAGESWDDGSIPLPDELIEQGDDF
ncbi:MAG: hypothetical protein ACK5FE_13005 [Cyanobacteriota bacterium]|jgi:hypothetical protein